MYSDPITKYAFRIRTRTGALVENLLIHGQDETEAQRKLRQMYPHCEVIDCSFHRGGMQGPMPSFEDVVNLIVR